MERVLLLTGRPGVGKTSLIREAIAVSGVRAGGFYTEEVRGQGVRVGFDIVTLDGGRGVLSRVDLNSPCRVGRYKVDGESLERLGVAAIESAVQECDTVVVDEIGEMELFSSAFREAVLKAIRDGTQVLGTVMLRSHPWADELKQRRDVSIVEITTRNRDWVLGEVVEWLGMTRDDACDRPT
jgi:nucleoside-triphosphatase